MKNIGGWGRRSTVPSIFRTLFQLPSSVSRNPFVCRSDETPGVAGYSYDFGMRYSLLHDRRCSAAAMQHSARRGGFFADIAHSNDARRVPAARGARDVADFFAVQRQRCAPFRHNLAGKSQPDTLAVDLAAGAHALDDFLAGVAAFGIADVAVLQTGLVRDLFFAEVTPEPRNALREAGGAQRRVTDRAAAVLARGFRKNLSKGRQVFGFGDEFGAGDSSWRALRDTAGNRADGTIVAGKGLKLACGDAPRL